MKLEYTQQHSYKIDETSKIQTDFGVTYKAYDLKNNSRPVCIKAIKINPKAEQQEVAKAKKEVIAMLMVRENCDNIPIIYDYTYSAEEKTFYIIMEWVEGKNLANLMKETLIDQKKMLDYMIILSDILNKMQMKNISHKDIKPENIMISKSNKFYLIDFNISLSLTNKVEGTRNYMAPEVGTTYNYAGRNKVDMFAIGVILYEYYLGRPPLSGMEYYSSMDDEKNWQMFLEPNNNPGILRPISGKINAIIKKCMELYPENRYKDYYVLKKALIDAKK